MERGDHLSEILDFVEVRSAVSGGSVVEGRWRTASTIDNDLKFIAVVHGSARLQVDGSRKSSSWALGTSRCSMAGAG